MISSIALKIDIIILIIHVKYSLTLFSPLWKFMASPDRPTGARRPGARIPVSYKQPQAAYGKLIPAPLVGPLATTRGQPFPSLEVEKDEGPCKLDAKMKENILAEAQKLIEKIPTGVITSTQIALFSAEQLKNIAVAEITSYDAEGKFSVNDPRLGVTDNKSCCKTCYKSAMECDGHLGIIPLAERFYHPQYIRDIISVLNSVCNSCGSLFFSKEDLNDKNILRYSGRKRLEMIEDQALKLDRDKAVCRKEIPSEAQPCGMNPNYVKTKLKDTHQIMIKMGDKKEKGNEVVKPIDEVANILNSISDEDALLLGFQEGSHPRNFIITNLPVIPPIARPPQIREGVFYPNPTSKLYRDIIKCNLVLVDRAKIELDKDGPTTIQNARKRLFNLIAHLIDNSDHAYSTLRNKPFDSIKELIQTKEGLVRGLMMGKRVDFSARTVAGPDPTLRFGQFRVPRVMASKLTVPVVINEINRAEMQALLDPLDKNIPSQITHVTQAQGRLKGTRFMVNENVRGKIILGIGDKVERYRQDGDPIVFNRQPTLHKQSMQGAETKLGKQLTNGAHLSYTTPLNLDFDGDETNLHAPQSVDAATEVMELMHVRNSIISPETSRPMMAAVFDSLDGSFLLTQDQTIIPVDSLDDLFGFLTRRDQLSTLAYRLKKHNVSPVSGRAMFSALLPADFDYEKEGVRIKDGILLNNAPDEEGKMTKFFIAKGNIGVSHGSIVQFIHKDYGKTRTADFLTDVPFIIDPWFFIRGFSVGLQDCIPEKPEEQAKLLDEEVGRARLKVHAYGAPPTDPLELERWEKQISAVVRSVDALGTKIVNKVLPDWNAFRIMFKSGAKGNAVNVAQIMAMLGQQFVKGERPKPTLSQGYALYSKL